MSGWSLKPGALTPQPGTNTLTVFLQWFPAQPPGEASGGREAPRKGMGGNRKSGSTLKSPSLEGWLGRGQTGQESGSGVGRVRPVPRFHLASVTNLLPLPSLGLAKGNSLLLWKPTCIPALLTG